MAIVFVAFMTGAAATAALAQGGTNQLETVVVTAPLPGAGVDPDKAIGEIQSLSIDDLLQDRQSSVLPDTVATQLSNVSLNDEQGSQFQPDFDYRGFEASPISGVAEGIAVYQNGMRLNEAFGDAVNWDLIPEFAIQNFTLQSNNPVFGLNAIGGAISLGMKDGFVFSGATAELSGGSYGNVTGNAQYGGQFRNWGLYLGVGGVHDDGFRYHSPTRIGQLYSDIGYKSGDLTADLTLSGADNTLDAVGPTPIEMLRADRRSVFTYPQTIANRMGLVQLRSTWRAAGDLTLSGDLYVRQFDQKLIDGNTTDVETCDNDPAQLCLEGDNLFPGDALYDSHGDAVPANALPAGATPGETDFTHTRSRTWGAALQMTSTARLFGHANNLTAGASIDQGRTDYGAYGELGTLENNLYVAPSGVVIDQGLSPTASVPIEAPVSVGARNTYTGLYAVDVFDMTPQVALTVSGRYNGARIELRDRLGTSLNGDHDFNRINPGAGMTYKLTDRMTAYAGASQSNRAPTAGELSCADPAAPCLLDAFLVSDPALKQVVSRNYELGLRGSFVSGALPGAFVWNVSAYRTDAARDILLLATDVNGFGYFQNAGTTRHEGVDAHLGYRDTRWDISASYSYLDATFRHAEILSSDSPSADAYGLIYVRPGDRIPLNPANRATLSVDYMATSLWSLGADLRLQSEQYLAGDQSNEQPKMPGDATIDLRTSYRLTSRLQLFGEVQNLLDQHYFTYGTFTELDGLPPNFHLANPRTFSPAPGRLFYGGVRVVL
ncbi:MAG TPA: TonB-dependent receptor [Rhizomicrobium sp.]|nr:TonB-dependent receptor [Rhizomicrobium sp.]